MGFDRKKKEQHAQKNGKFKKTKKILQKNQKVMLEKITRNMKHL